MYSVSSWIFLAVSLCFTITTWKCMWPKSVPFLQGNKFLVEIVAIQNKMKIFWKCIIASTVNPVQHNGSHFHDWFPSKEWCLPEHTRTCNRARILITWLIWHPFALQVADDSLQSVVMKNMINKSTKKRAKKNMYNYDKCWNSYEFRKRDRKYFQTEKNDNRKNDHLPVPTCKCDHIHTHTLHKFTIPHHSRGVQKQLSSRNYSKEMKRK